MNTLLVIVMLIMAGIIVSLIILCKLHRVEKSNTLSIKMDSMLSKKIDNHKIQDALCVGDGSKEVCLHCKYRGIRFGIEESEGAYFHQQKGYYCKLKN